MEDKTNSWPGANNSSTSTDKSWQQKEVLITAGLPTCLAVVQGSMWCESSKTCMLECQAKAHPSCGSGTG